MFYTAAIHFILSRWLRVAAVRTVTPRYISANIASYLLKYGAAHKQRMKNLENMLQITQSF